MSDDMTVEQTPVHDDNENPLDSMGKWSFFVIGLIFGFLAAAGIGIVFLMALDPLGPSERVAVEETSSTSTTAATEAATWPPATPPTVKRSTPRPALLATGPTAQGSPVWGYPW